MTSYYDKELWNVWLGPECEGDEQGRDRLFVHQMPWEMGYEQRVKFIRDAMHEHHVSEVYFCREHIEDHGVVLPVSVAQFDETERVYVCLAPTWPATIASELTLVPKHKLRPIIEVDCGSLWPVLGREMECKLLWRNFNVSCTNVSGMPHSSGRLYDADECILKSKDRGQVRRFRDGVPCNYID